MDLNDDELRALSEQQKKKFDALDAKYDRISREIATRESQNPYESPRESSESRRKPINPTIIALIIGAGLILFGVLILAISARAV